MNNLIKIFSVYVFIILVCGCVTTTGPKVARQDIDIARSGLEVQALEYKYKQALRVNNVGYRILKNIEPEDVVFEESYPYLGLLLDTVNEKTGKLFRISGEEGIVVASVVESSPAQAGGMRAGDVITSIDEYNIRNISDFIAVTKKLSPYDHIVIKGNRGRGFFTSQINLEAVPVDITFQIVDSPNLLAWTDAFSIQISYGMLRFVESDDELAVILSHELAHIARGHINREGAGIFSGLIGGILENVLPNIGKVIVEGTSAAVSAPFSQDLEREADYFSILYTNRAGYNIDAGVKIWERFAIEIPKTMSSNYLSSHPSSPERMLRIEKIIEELRSASCTF